MDEISFLKGLVRPGSTLLRNVVLDRGPRAGLARGPRGLRFDGRRRHRPRAGLHSLPAGLGRFDVDRASAVGAASAPEDGAGEQVDDEQGSEQNLVVRVEGIRTTPPSKELWHRTRSS